MIKPPRCEGDRDGIGGRVRAIVAIGIAAWLAGAGVAAAQADVRIHGSTTVGSELLPALIEAYAGVQGLTVRRTVDAAGPGTLDMTAFFEVQPVVRFQLERKGSATAFRSLLAGSADIGMASRAIQDTEASALGGEGVDMRSDKSEHVVALDGLAMIVAPQNPVSTISKKEIAAIYAGEITDWRQLGFGTGPIRAHVTDQGGAFDSFTALALQPFGARISPQVRRHPSYQSVLSAVRSDPLALGVVPLSFMRNAKPLALALECGLIISPNEFAVKAEEYPLARRLHLYTRGAPQKPEARGLIDFAKSAAAQSIVSEVGFVNQALSLQRAEDLADHMMGAIGLAVDPQQKDIVLKLLSESADSGRLSTTFRFISGEADLLDAKSLADAGRIARWLEQPENQARKIKLMGFSDNEGGIDANVGLSLQRAEAARRAILINVAPGFDVGRIQTLGFGPIAPVACNDDEIGRGANRRVEVWVGE